MQIKKLGRDIQGSWTLALQSKAQHEFIPGWPHPAFGIALLWYRPERRLSVSVWCQRGSTNIRLWGPRKLSWERSAKAQ